MEGIWRFGDESEELLVPDQLHSRQYVCEVTPRMASAGLHGGVNLAFPVCQDVNSAMANSLCNTTLHVSISL